MVTQNTYRNSSSPYPIAPLPIPNHVQFSHNTCITDDRQKTERQLEPWHNR